MGVSNRDANTLTSTRTRFMTGCALTSWMAGWMTDTLIYWKAPPAPWLTWGLGAFPFSFECCCTPGRAKGREIVPTPLTKSSGPHA